MARIYKARVGSPFKVEDAQEIGLFFEKHSGKSTMELLNIVKESPNERIYKYIEWNDETASHQFRLHQIRNIMNHIEVEIIGIPNRVPLRAFYNVQENPDSKNTVYIDVETMFTNDYYRNQVLSKALTEIKNWKERYKQYKELKPLIDHIEKIVPQIDITFKKEEQTLDVV